MDDGQEIVESESLPIYGDHRFLALIIGSIVIAISLVVVSIMLYYRSGAAQLDLSRPGYNDVRSKVVAKDESFIDIPITGIIDKNTINDFQKLYDLQSEKAQLIDAFGSDPLNPNALWLSIATEQ